MMVPLVTVLIPAYQDFNGVERIISKVPEDLLASGSLEIIVSDDSPDFEIFKMFETVVPISKAVRIVKGKRQGAVSNWNTMLEKARGQYIQFLHHDECPSDSEFFYSIIELVKLANKLQDSPIFFHSCMVNFSKSPRLHSRALYSQLLLHFFPKFLYRQNFLGSPSILLVPATRAVEFDAKLKYLVDVDWYDRIRIDINARFSQLEVNSYPSSGSITAQIGDNQAIRVLRGEELSYLGTSRYRMKPASIICAYMIWAINRLTSYLWSSKSY